MMDILASGWAVTVVGFATLWFCFTRFGQYLRSDFSALFAKGVSMVFAAGLSFLAAVCWPFIAFLTGAGGRLGVLDGLALLLLVLAQALVAVIGGVMIVRSLKKGVAAEKES